MEGLIKNHSLEDQCLEETFSLLSKIQATRTLAINKAKILKTFLIRSLANMGTTATILRKDNAHSDMILTM
jgi:hypothetical protein